MNRDLREVYIVEGCRTPFLKARGNPGPFSASDLAVLAGQQLLSGMPFAPNALDEVVLGCVVPSVDEANIARLVALRLGCGKRVPGYTVQRNCASGLQALDCAYKDIAMGRHELVLAGGTEAMSRAPLLYNNTMVQWFAELYAAKNLPARLKQFLKFRPSHLKPVIALLRGLTDPLSNYSMGQTAEQLAYEWAITRTAMDTYACRSHERLALAQDQHSLSEITPIYDGKGLVYVSDDGLRRDSTIEKLQGLKPFFDKKYGSVTAGNSSQISDGAAVMLLASSVAVKKYGLNVIGRIVDTRWAGCEPKTMGLGPVYAIADILKHNYLRREDIGAWEINEAFAAQVLACVQALSDRDFCRDELQCDEAIGLIPADRLNVDGGAIALGHPVGASGARVALHCLQVLKRLDARLGIASLCIGGGQGGAMLIENVTEVVR